MTLFFTPPPDAPSPRLPGSQIDSAIPAHHPHKAAIEETLVELTRLPGGPWRVEVRPARTYGWWFIHVAAQGCGFEHTMTLNPDQQTPDGVRAAWSRAWLGFDTSPKEVPL